MTHKAAFRKVFLSEKMHKEAFEAPCVCFIVLPEAFREYLKKLTL